MPKFKRILTVVTVRMRPMRVRYGSKGTKISRPAGRISRLLGPDRNIFRYKADSVWNPSELSFILKIIYIQSK
jgi:hypothetical protein